MGHPRSRPETFSPAEWEAILARLGLSGRPAEVLGYVVQGFEDDEIASFLGTKRPTVRTQFTEVRKRLGVRNRTEATYVAFKTFVDLFYKKS